MRGVCLLRLKRMQEANQELAIAGSLTGGRRVSMSMNVAALTKLYQSRASRDSKLVDDAISDLTSIIEHDKQFVPAYMNLACAYAEKGDYPVVTRYLVFQVIELAISSAALLNKIFIVLTRPSDRFLTG